MGKGYLIDSNAVIDFCNGKLPNGGRELLFSIEQPEISVITHVELFGAKHIDSREEKSLEDFVSIAKVHPLNLQVALKTIEIRKKVRMKLPDAAIAATALVHDLILVSRNISDFKNIPALALINPHEI